MVNFQVISKAAIANIMNLEHPYIQAKITASTECTSPEDLDFSVKLVGTSTEFVIKKKAEKRCACQVCYHKSSDNCWKATFAFLPETLLEVRILYIVL